MLVVTDGTMRLGVNNNINQGAHKASLKHMAGGSSKINPPNSYTSNPIHKKATEAQGLAPKQAKVKDTTTQTQTQTQTQKQTKATNTQTQTITKENCDDTHHINKALVGIGALVFVGLVMWASK